VVKFFLEFLSEIALSLPVSLLAFPLNMPYTQAKMETNMERQKRPVRFFNTTGPCYPWDHYMLPPEDRLIGAQLDRYVGDKLYWVLHAPRQTGKTTFLQSWARELNSSKEGNTFFLSVKDVKTYSDCDNIIKEITEKSNKESFPIICLMDDMATLEEKILAYLLSRIRAEFNGRRTSGFPDSMLFTCLSDLRNPNINTPFNIIADSELLDNFTRENISSLFAQRTAETGQEIEKGALDYVWEQSRGQPWIVNSLFKRATMRVLKADDYQTVTLDHIKEARQQMILARETHLDALGKRLADPRVRHVIEVLMVGEPDPNLTQTEGWRLCEDLGLCQKIDGTPQVANPIYREVLAREMTYSTQDAIPKPEFRWQTADGSLDMDALLKEFQQFWRRYSESWEKMMNWPEVVPHLLLQAFLQRVLNGGGRIEREYAAGSGRMDLSVIYNDKEYIIEIKVVHPHDSLKTVKEEGLVQIKRYRDKIGRPEAGPIPAYLVIFDRRSSARKNSWTKRLSWAVVDGITVLGC
jgi:hypothetical protein